MPCCCCCGCYCPLSMLLCPRMWVPCGSLQYLAPEVLAGRYSSQRDIWSIGCVTFQLLCGRHPISRPDSQVVALLQQENFREVLGLAEATSLQDAAGMELPQ
ncbi:unnamed protein product, partial [Polarella glacialis]